MAIIRFHNVEHGDCILLGLDNNILVTRDFGSCNVCVKNYIKRCVGRFPKHLRRCHLYHDFCPFDSYEAILTHPHGDHYSGYETMHKLGCRMVYDRAYVPYLDLNTVKSTPSFHSQQLKTALCFMAVMPSSKTQKVQDWIKVAPMMYDLSKHLIGVYQGCNAFNHWQPYGTVLWPPQPMDAYYTRSRKKLDDMLDAFSSNVREYADSVYDELSGILTSLFDKDNYFQGYSDNKNNDKDFYFAEEEDRNGALSKVNRLLDEIAGKFANENNEYAQKMYTSFGTLIDDHSVVFSISNNENGSDDKSALFLSDLNEEPMEYMVDKFIIPNTNHYTILKSAHHGTRLSKNLQNNVTADFVVHSCGLGQGNLKFLHPGYIQMCNNQTIDCTSWNSISPNWSNKPVSPYEVKGTLDFTL